MQEHVHKLCSKLYLNNASIYRLVETTRQNIMLFPDTRPKDMLSSQGHYIITLGIYPMDLSDLYEYQSLKLCGEITGFSFYLVTYFGNVCEYLCITFIWL